MERRDHHDWASEAYVAEWVERQHSRDPARTERLQLLCDLLPFSSLAHVTILDVGAGYAPVSKYILDQFPHATCIAQDGSAPMLQHARQRMADYGPRFMPHQSDLFDPQWIPQHLGPFDAAVSALCLHNLRDFPRICGIYSDIRTQLKPGGVFLNLDLLNAPDLELQQRYGQVVAARRQREGAADEEVEALRQRARQFTVPGAQLAFPASLDQHLAALKAAGFTSVDCFWKDVQQALYGGYV